MKKIKKITTTILAGVGILLAGAAEAVPVSAGSYQTNAFTQFGTFSGDSIPGGFAVTNFNTGGGATINLATGRVDGLIGGGNGGPGTIQIGGAPCSTVIGSPVQPCSATLTFMFAPNPTADEPFTMTGQLFVGTANLLIEGTGMLHVISAGPQEELRFTFAAAEPSTVVLVLSGLVAVGWSRWRGGKRAGRSRSTAAAD